jgi:hypothetical protein
MNHQTTTTQSDFIPSLKISMEFIEAFFKYLPYKKRGELRYALTYYYQDTHIFSNVDEIISDIERCIQYQTSEKRKVDIPAEIVFELEIIANGKEIELFYHGQLILQDSIAIILWNWYQSSPKVELSLNEAIPLSKILSLFENFQTAICDIITKNE